MRLTKSAPLTAPKITLEERDGLKLAKFSAVVKFGGTSGGISLRPRVFGNLDRKRIKFLWCHDPGEPVGRVAGIVADDSRIHVDLELLLTTQRGSEALELLRQNCIDQVGLGFRATKTSKAEVGGEPVVVIERAELLEVSLTSLPVTPLIGTVDVKAAAPKTEAELIEALTGAGLTPKAARDLVAGGFKQMIGQKPADDAKARELAKMLRQLARTIESNAGALR